LHHLFVYGTLRRGSDNKFARMLADRARFVGTARVQGQLFDLGQYPGARRAEQTSETILGEIFYLEDPGAILAALDEYEGAEFERAVVTTEGKVDCWIYWYVGSEPGHPIPSGDWFQR
jgi:gamma-glutamylcyclotransferase (GGCT)/AIG2-like uncharacterized protein YtfP